MDVYSSFIPTVCDQHGANYFNSCFNGNHPRLLEKGKDVVPFAVHELSKYQLIDP